MLFRKLPTSISSSLIFKKPILSCEFHSLLGDKIHRQSEVTGNLVPYVIERTARGSERAMDMYVFISKIEFFFIIF